MPTNQTCNVFLTAEVNAFIRSQVACGRYQNASEVVQASLLQQQDQLDRRKRSIPMAKHTNAR